MDESERASVAYVAVVERVPGKEFRIRFPDFAEVHARAESIEGASEHAAQALRTRIDDLLRNGERVPRPTSVDAVKADPDNRHGFLLQIDVEVPRKSVFSWSRGPDPGFAPELAKNAETGSSRGG
jgi:predicted RNase H-like HicB family nuclease